MRSLQTVLMRWCWGLIRWPLILAAGYCLYSQTSEHLLLVYAPPLLLGLLGMRWYRGLQARRSARDAEPTEVDPWLDPHASTALFEIAIRLASASSEPRASSGPTSELVARSSQLAEPLQLPNQPAIM
jgi:hypothetical protein